MAVWQFEVQFYDIAFSAAVAAADDAAGGSMNGGGDASSLEEDQIAVAWARHPASAGLVEGAFRLPPAAPDSLVPPRLVLTWDNT